MTLERCFPGAIHFKDISSCEKIVPIVDCILLLIPTTFRIGNDDVDRGKSQTHNFLIKIRVC